MKRNRRCCCISANHCKSVFLPPSVLFLEEKKNFRGVIKTRPFIVAIQDNIHWWEMLNFLQSKMYMNEFKVQGGEQFWLDSSLYKIFLFHCKSIGVLMRTYNFEIKWKHLILANAKNYKLKTSNFFYSTLVSFENKISGIRYYSWNL